MKLLTLFLTLTLSINLTFASETDQYSSAFYDITDSTDLLDEVVNTVIQRTADYWTGRRNDFRFVKLITNTLDDTQIEPWLENNPEHHSLTFVNNHIFAKLGFRHTSLLSFVHHYSSININGVHLGADKVTHFFGVGSIYYRLSELETPNLSEEEKLEFVIDHGVETENKIWGKYSSRIFSNADLVANFEGYKFLLGLFKDDIVAGKRSIIKWKGNKPIVQRRFTFRDHVNDFWSELYNPNYYFFPLSILVRRNIKKLCYRRFYQENKDHFTSKHSEKLKRMYSILKFKNADKFSMAAICAKVTPDKLIETPSLPPHKYEGREDDSFYHLNNTKNPVCKKKYKKAKHEYSLIRKRGDVLSELMTTNILPLIQNYLSFKEKTSGLKKNISKAIKVIKKKFPDLKIKKKYKTLGENNDSLQFCVKSKLTFSSKKVRKDIKAALRYCYIINTDRNTLDIDLQWEAIYDGQRLYSMPNFQDYYDMSAYAYKTTHKYCRKI